MKDKLGTIEEITQSSQFQDSLVLGLHERTERRESHIEIQIGFFDRHFNC